MFYTILIAILILCFGAIIGSFLNVVIYRLRKDKPIIKSRSHCPVCSHKLGFHELFPILSFIIQGGKCRSCTKKISWQYPLVEAATGALFVFSAFYLTDYTLAVVSTTHLIHIALAWIFLCFFVIIFVYDLRYYLILNKITYPGIVLGLINLVFFSFISEQFWVTFLYGILAAVVAGGFFYLLFAVSKGKWMGGGDVKLAFMIGLFIHWPNILAVLFFAFILGSIVGLILMGFFKKGLKTRIPFGTFLVVATLIVYFTSSLFIDSYLTLLGF